MSDPLNILATGMVTCVGLDAPSSCAAMRAKLDGFQETRFLGPGGEWQVGAPVPLPRPWIGTKRLAHMAAAAICEVFERVPEAEGRTSLILCLAEPDRPGRLPPDAEAFARQVAEITEMPARTRTRIVAHGRPSGFVALDQARRLLARGEEYVMIVGVDTYLTTLSIAHYAACERLLTPANHDGFIPGEAAAAVLCSARHPGGLRLASLGLAREEAFIHNGLDEDGLDLPLRGDGMVRAYRQALDEARLTLAGIEYRISDLIGEQYWFRQTSLTSVRLMRAREEFQALWSPGENVGNVGAAVVPLMIGSALTAAAKDYAPGSPVLIEASSDDGACGAAVLRARAA